MKTPTHRLFVSLVGLFCALSPLCCSVDVSAAEKGTVAYNRQGLQIDGRDTFIYSGAFHYFRVSPSEWRDRFAKMKAAGFNGVETYVPWNYHERLRPAGLDDFSRLDLTELAAWLRMAEEFGFYVTIRPGPYICAEWDAGGFPQWLLPAAKSASWPADKAWLQTDDPAFLAWNRHWIDAVCRVVAPHQITRKPAGSAGVILFQIENEFNRVNWLPSSVKRRYLEALARFSRDGGIDVPLVTCWTNESRAVKDGPLRGVFDFLNRYPKWEVEKQLAPNTQRQIASQPDAPLMSMELQGGWYSEVGGQLSHEQDGIAPVQTQNLTLYLLQLGYSYINYYMLVGGTNFDDWASRDTTTTYDFAAAIGEDGAIGERYARVAAIGDFLRTHGAPLMRSTLLDLKPAVSNPEVQVAVRETPTGDRYFFVRTENRTGPQGGVVTFSDGPDRTRSFRFELEPFGARILHVPASATHGEWFPRPAAVTTRAAAPASLPIVIDTFQTRSAPAPRAWTALAAGASLDDHGIVDRHFVDYRVTVPGGLPFTVRRIGDQVVNKSRGDAVLAAIDGRLIEPLSVDAEGVTFAAPPRDTEVRVLWENRGMHHHTSVALEQNWRIGLRDVTSGGRALPLEFAAEERAFGLRVTAEPTAETAGWTTTTPGASARPADPADGLLRWYRFSFRLPPDAPDVTWRLRLEAAGNGFLYVNGHCLGRVWEEGPQTEFYLPASVLRAGADGLNQVALSLRPTARGAHLLKATLLPVLNDGQLGLGEPQRVAFETVPALSSAP